MTLLKRYLGVIWLLPGPVFIFFLVYGAILNIDPEGKKDINKPIIWIIIISIFTPIAIGLMIFGWYAFNGEYDHLPESSQEIQD